MGGQIRANHQSGSKKLHQLLLGAPKEKKRVMLESLALIIVGLWKILDQ
jgi:hypothetical protein